AAGAGPRWRAGARRGPRLPPLAALGGQGVLGRQGRRGTRHEAERPLQAADLRDVPGRPRRDGAHPVLRRGSPPVGLGLSASRQRLAQLASGDRAADAPPVAGDAPQADSRQCRGALRAGIVTMRASYALVAGVAAVLSALGTWAGMFLVTPSAAQPAGGGGQPIGAQRLADVPGGEVRRSLIERPPGFASPPHRHPGHHTFGYVLEGTYEFAIDRGQPRLLKAGDTFYEPPTAVHS